MQTVFSQPMAQGLDLTMVREHYAKMTDAELTRILTADAAGITPEARAIAVDEGQKRNFHQDILTAIDKQRRAFMPSEIDALSDVIRKLDCPKCGRAGKGLNASLVAQTMSFLIMTRYKRQLVIACPDCLDRAMLEANTMTALLGWWGFPWGLIRTPQSLYRNIRSKRGHRAAGPNEILLDFVSANAALIDTYKTQPAILDRLIGQKG